MSQECMSYWCIDISPYLLTTIIAQFKMKRNPRKLAWTKAFRSAHGKEMPIDGILANFAQRRNVPVRYNRETTQKTLEAMTRIQEIRDRRERAFYKERMKGNKARQLEADRKLVAENQHLLPPQYRDQVEAAMQDMPAAQVLEEEIEEEMEEDMEEELPLEEQQRLAPKKSALKQKKKQKLVRGKGVEAMDVDG